MNLRERLKSETARCHRELDSLPLLAKYASAKAQKEEYAQVIKGFLNFYKMVGPATKNLPRAFHDYLQVYIQALEADLSDLDLAAAFPPNRPKAVNEVAFFYLLLGSSLGASRIIRNYAASELPMRHLAISQEKGTKLWPRFLTAISEAPSGPSQTIESAIELFAKLKRSF